MRVDYASEKSRLQCDIDNLNQRLKGKPVDVYFNQISSSFKPIILTTAKNLSFTTLFWL
jgi:hypothetical protein